MFFRYGPYQHPDNEVNLTSFEVIPRRSERGRQMTVHYRMHLLGELIHCGQADIHTAIQQLIAAYAYDNMGDAGLFHDDGTPTRHYIPQNHQDNLTGVRVTHRSWPKGDAAEYATLRTFYIVLEADFRYLEGELTAWQEVVRTTGNCGPRWDYFESQNDLPRPEILNRYTVQTIVQSGSAVGFDGWPMLHVPGPLYPSQELEYLREITPYSPKFMGQQWAEYPIEWKYVMRSNQPLASFPHIK